MPAFQEGYGAECPNDATRLLVVDTRWSDKWNGVMRRRKCPKCNYRVSTIETIIPPEQLLRGTPGHVKTT